MILPISSGKLRAYRLALSAVAAFLVARAQPDLYLFDLSTPGKNGGLAARSVLRDAQSTASAYVQGFALRNRPRPSRDAAGALMRTLPPGISLL
jgi:CheY-like chemotaxis protein